MEWQRGIWGKISGFKILLKAPDILGIFKTLSILQGVTTKVYLATGASPKGASPTTLASITSTSTL